MLQDIKTLVYPQYVNINFLATSAVGKNYVIGHEQISYLLLKFVKEVQHSRVNLSIIVCAHVRKSLMDR